jgi:hypothetical protein
LFPLIEFLVFDIEGIKEYKISKKKTSNTLTYKLDITIVTNTKTMNPQTNFTQLV